jgi:peptide-methionine (R)-S-oxide reductase
MKFSCGCGWPAFSACIEKRVNEKEDISIPGRARVETLCGNCDAHLGHVFNDGVVPPNYLRYCINSASIDFIPK